MSPEQVDQQLEWDTLLGFCQFWNANAQTIRPLGSYTTRRIGVLLARFEEIRRGPGVIRLEEVSDPELPGRLLAEWPWYSDELGPPDSPKWILRGVDEIGITSGKQYRIVVHTTPGWEVWDEDKLEWKPWEEGAAIMIAVSSSGDKFSRGEYQYGYNYRDASGKWRSSYNVDAAFIFGTEAYSCYQLFVFLTPEGGGTVEVNPRSGCYEPGTEVTLTAVPASGYKFTGWAGDATGTDPTITVVMDSTITVVANFGDEGLPDIPIISDIIAWLKALFESLYEWLKAQFLWLLAEIEKLLWSVLNAVLAPIIAALNWLQDKILDVWYWLTETIPDILNWIKGKIDEMWDWITKAIPEALSWMKERLDDMWNWITEKIPELINTVMTKVMEIWDWITTQLVEALDWMKNTLTEIGDTLKTISEEVLAFIKDTVGLMWDFILQIKDEVLAFFADPLAWTIEKILGPITEAFNTGLESTLPPTEGVIE